MPFFQNGETVIENVRPLQFLVQFILLLFDLIHELVYNK